MRQGYRPGSEQRAEIALNHVAVLDVRSGKVLPNRLGLVTGEVITALTDAVGHTTLDSAEDIGHSAEYGAIE
jgi:hypothetical protein